MSISKTTLDQRLPYCNPMMKLDISRNPVELGQKLAQRMGDIMCAKIAARGEINIILASAASQIEMLKNLVKDERIDWSKVTMFHLDEYIGIDADHPARFANFLKERFLAHVPPLKETFLINSTGDPHEEVRRLNAAAQGRTIDLACIGVGENAHIAFNDPPADFEIEDPFLIVTLDEVCRQQQLAEGWFKTLDDVPKTAISMSARYIMRSETIVAPVPGPRKADAIRATFEGPITNMVPCTILQQHPDCTIYCDHDSISKMENPHRFTV